MIGEYNVVARIRCDYVSKFGIPRQSGIISESEAVIIFEPEYRSREAIRGLEDYNYVWLIWLFSENIGKGFRPTVRPPRLGGNSRVGVFATRSPFRPNPVGLSSVRLTGIDHDAAEGPLLHVAGADLMDGTPIIDIKPYIPYADIHTDATGGFSDTVRNHSLKVGEGLELLRNMPEKKAEVLKRLLEQDPRPAYHDEPGRVYAFEYAEYHVEFCVEDDIVRVLRIQSIKDSGQ